VVARGSTLMDLHGVGPSGAARLLADVGDIRRFADRDRFASWNGTAPLDASSGQCDRSYPLHERPAPDSTGREKKSSTGRCRGVAASGRVGRGSRP